MKYTWCVVAILLAGFAAFAGKTRKATLPGTNGTYSTLASYDIDSGPGPDVGTITAKVRKPKSGKKLRLTMTGIVDPSDTPVPIFSTLKFDSRHRVRSNSYLLGYFGPSATRLARFKQSRRTLTFKLRTIAGGSTIQGSLVESAVTYRLKLGRRSFTLSGSGSIRPIPGGTPNPVTIALTGRLKK